MDAVTVLKPGPFTTVRDIDRNGWLAFGGAKGGDDR